LPRRKRPAASFHILIMGEEARMIRSRLMCFAATRKPAEALTFYRDTVGLKFVADEPFAVVFDDHATTLRVQKVQQLVPAGHTLLGWQVSDIADRARELAARGVRFERFDGMVQDELRIWTSPAGARVAWFKDPDGNILSLTEFSR